MPELTQYVPRTASQPGEYVTGARSPRRVPPARDEGSSGLRGTQQRPCRADRVGYVGATAKSRSISGMEYASGRLAC
ncbi:protein of unknown function [Paraburkholderia kururiensis]